MSDPTLPPTAFAPTPYNWATDYGQPYAGRSAYPVPQQPIRSVRGLASATQILLSVQILAAVGVLFAVLHERSLLRRILSNPRSVSLADVSSADNTLNAVSLVGSVVYIATGVVWIIWFHRAYTNAAVWSPRQLRRSPGWAIGAWFIPIANLVIPFGIARDIVQASDSTRTARWRGLLGFWWAGFLAMLVAGIAERAASHPKTIDGLMTYTDLALVNVALTVGSAILAIAVVHKLTELQETRRAARC